MDILIEPHPLSGSIEAIPSKSMAHRLLILSALCSGITDIRLTSTSEDIDATLRCLTAIGASAGRTRQGLRIVPVTVRGVRKQARLDVGESGSTLRFLLPIVAALGRGAEVSGHGRLAERPLAPLDEQLEAHGATIAGVGSFPLEVSGALTAGSFELPGSVSSQFASGLLMAAPLMDGTVEVLVREPVESRPYIDLTVSALATFGVDVVEGRATRDGQPCRRYVVDASASLVSPGTCVVEGDWSNAAFWLAAGALDGEPLCVSGLDARSRQGDRSVMAALSLLGARVGRGSGLVAASRDALHGHVIDVSAIPDLVPPLAIVAAHAAGTTRLAKAGRLRLKESDRLATVTGALASLGGQAQVDGDDLVVEGVERLRGGTVDAANDHRIAMMAAICGAYATEPTTILGADCVAKSYPHFFDDFRSLGGVAHQIER